MTRPEFLLLALLLVFSPLAFGAVEPWSLAVLESGAFAALALALRRRRHGGGVSVAAVPGALPLGLLLGLVALQALPLPPALVGLLSPRALALHRETLGAAAPLSWATLSLAPAATLRELLRLGAFAAAYVLAVQLLGRRERLRAIAVLLAAAAAGIAFLALVQSIVAPTRLLLLRPAPPDSTPFGPYVNRNHYGNLMAMLTPVVLGLFLAFPAGAGRAAGWRARLAGAIARPESGARLLLGFAALLAGASLLVSRSRGATAALLAALLLLGAMGLAGGRARGRAVPMLLLAGAFALFTGWFGWERLAERIIATGASGRALDPVRAFAWGDTLRMAADFPLLGSGVGAFADLYPRYRSIPGTERLTHAHNDWLELLAGAGVAGFALAGWFVAAALAAALRGLRERDDPFARSVAAGAIAGSAAFLLHALTDFSLALGANGLCFFTLLGVAVAANAGAAPGARRTLPRPVVPVAFAVAAAVLAVGAGDVAARLLWRRSAEESRLLAGLPRPPEATRRRFALAARLAPLEPEYRLELARMAAAGGEPALARARALQALRRRPTDPDALGEMARIAAAAGEPAAAGRLLAAAVAADPRDAERRIAHGAWLLSRGERAAGLRALGKAMALRPDRISPALTVAALHRVPDAEIAAAVPGDALALRSLARYAEGVGSEALAESAWRRAAAVADARQAREGARGLQRFLAARARRLPAGGAD